MTALPDDLLIHVLDGQCVVTDPQTRSTFTLQGELTDANVAAKLAAHRERWFLDELQYAPAVEKLRAAGFLPSRSQILADVLRTKAVS